MAIDLNTYGIIELATLGYLICTIKRKGVVQCCQFSSGVDPAICKRGVPTYDKKGGSNNKSQFKRLSKGGCIANLRIPFPPPPSGRIRHCLLLQHRIGEVSSQIFV